MDRSALIFIGVVFVGFLAALNAWRGASRLREGDTTGGAKHMVLALAMIGLIGAAIALGVG